jgi:hypothetical protein
MLHRLAPVLPQDDREYRRRDLERLESVAFEEPNLDRPSTPSRSGAAAVVVCAGVAAALHVGKLPPAMPALREHFGMSLLEVSLLVSAFQVAGMSMGILGGMLADRFGPAAGHVAGPVDHRLRQPGSRRSRPCPRRC